VAKAKIAKLDDNDGGKEVVVIETNEGPDAVGEEKKEKATGAKVATLGATEGVQGTPGGPQVRIVNGFRVIDGWDALNGK
jgi:hypothetical protein